MLGIFLFNNVFIIVLDRGRVKQLKGFVDWKDIDIGSEFIHGERSVLKNLIDQNVLLLLLIIFIMSDQLDLTGMASKTSVL